ncbi:MAG: sulfatase-like hydrolase/transferase [Spirochaetales bacterium]|nr:sulfatase-like hydrolase/transferase [Spirochaetales bacterium]
MLDICLFFSDQHSYLQQSYAGDSVVRTPNLDRIAKEGVAFDNNYTSYPLCVPARMSLMSGQLASKCQVMGNFSVLDSRRPTFAHCLNSIGYETVLCGRMHFVGPDQRHGFSKRIAGDITPIFQNRPTEAFKRERGVHLNTPTGGANCVTIIGAGNSPTLEFDRYVVQTALDYLKDSYEKPQFLCVGTYAPHHPYVAPKELYDYYYERVSAEPDTIDFPLPDFYKGKFRDMDPEVVRAVRAAYYAMVEFTDSEVGAVYDAFQEYLKRTGHEGIFIYASDHGDHIGAHGLYGKETFLEESSHTPMIFAGSGVAKGVRIKGATSLMDLGPTLCELAGAPIAKGTDGVSFASQVRGAEDDLERMVISELGGSISRNNPVVKYAQMVKYRNFKFVHYEGMDQDGIFDIEKDPHEKCNLIASMPELAERCRAFLASKCASYSEIEKNAQREAEGLSIFTKCDFDSDERWHAPDAARHYPEEMVSSKIKPKPMVWG